MTTKARIFRAAKGTGRVYFSMRCDTAQDSSLTWAARGMLAYFLSLRDGWELTAKDLQQKCGRDKAYSILAELRKAKYLQRDRVRKPDGTFTWGDYRVHERPYTANQEMDTELREPLPEKPYTVNTESNTHKSSKPKKTTASAVVPDDFKAIQEHTVNVVFGGNAAMFGKAGDIANWALRRNDKVQWAKLKPEKVFRLDEWCAFCLWYSEKLIAWPSSAGKWNKQAYEFRHDRRAHYSYMARINPPAPVEAVSDEVLAETMRKMGLVV